MSEPTAAFLDTVLADLAGLAAAVMAGVGDRLGLFAALAGGRATTPAELAARAAIDERYAREWLHGMTAAGYLAHDATGGTFSLPPERTPVLAEEAGRVFVGGTLAMTVALLHVIPDVEEAMRSGAGVSMDAYGEDVFVQGERDMGGVYATRLVDEWVAAMPAVRDLLEAGASVADVGCGGGGALRLLAASFPRSRFTGYDVFAPNVERAALSASGAGLGERVRFLRCDATRGLPGTHDVVLAFDVVHDAADPAALVRAIRAALPAGGRFVALEPRSPEHLDEHGRPFDVIRYLFSLLYCTSTSLAAGGAALGTLGTPESVMRGLCLEAGFSEVRRVPVRGVHALYEAVA